jgi:PAS domain S-box-containing protein
MCYDSNLLSLIRKQCMKSIDKLNLRSKINVIIILLLIIIVSEIFFVLKNISRAFSYQRVSLLILTIAILGMIFLVVKRILWVSIYRPVRKIEKVLKSASLGDLSNKTNNTCKDEFGEIARSLDKIIQNQSDWAEFLEKIGDGNFNLSYEVLSKDDKLGYSILSMKDKLQKLVSKETRSQWSTEGIAKFSAILRENNDDIKILCDKLLPELVDYMEANQAAIFLLNTEEKENTCLEMVSAYAWNRNEFLSNTIAIGEGLIGQAAVEKETIYMTDVPDNYIRITSGLGYASPKSILIVPLLLNDEVLGIMELAAFKPFETNEIDFVEKLSEIVASTVMKSNTNKQTQRLLKNSQKLTEELRTQKEELRQQGEILKSYTNELEDIKQNLSEKLNEASIGLQMKIQDIEMEKAKNIAILEGCVDCVISFDHTGKIEYFNNAAEETWGIGRDSILGKRIDSIIPVSIEQIQGSLRAFSTNNGIKREIGVRTEISWIDREGKDHDLLVTLTRAKVVGSETFTIFAQRISVDIF